MNKIVLGMCVGLLSSTVMANFENQLLKNSLVIKNQADRLGDIQAPYRVAGKPMRVRFFLSNAANIKKYLQAPKTHDKIMISNNSSTRYDRLVITGRSYNVFGRSVSQPSSTNLREFAEGGSLEGMAINPHLMLCASKALDQIASIADKYPTKMNEWDMEEINIFIKPVGNIKAVKEEDTKLYITNPAVVQNPIDPAINYQVPMVARTGECRLAKTEALVSAFNSVLSESR